MAAIKSPFVGKFDKIRKFVKKWSPGASWEKQPNGVWLGRWADGAVLGWSSTKGTIWFQGPPLHAMVLEQDIREGLDERARRARAKRRRRLKVRKPIIRI